MSWNTFWGKKQTKESYYGKYFPHPSAEKKSQAQWKTEKNHTWINYEKEKVSLNEEKLIGIKKGFVHSCKVQGEDFSLEQKRGIWDCLAA